MYNPYTKPQIDEHMYIREVSNITFKSIAKRLKKPCDIYWSEEFGALVKVVINGQQLMLPVFQTKSEALLFSKGSEKGYRNIICKFKVRYFESDYLKDNSNAFAVIGVQHIKETEALPKSNIVH
jgi:hypothetical protein